MIDETANRILMSDSIRGMVPELEEDSVQKFEDSFVITALEIISNEAKEVLVGNLVGISIEDIIKVDFRIKMEDAYNIIKRATLNQEMLCAAIQLHLADDGFRIQGPFKMSSHKMLDFDHPNKMCTLALDLTKVIP
jgi:hypothetical protein